jgi:hypothetical protein
MPFGRQGASSLRLSLMLSASVVGSADRSWTPASFTARDHAATIESGGGGRPAREKRRCSSPSPIDPPDGGGATMRPIQLPWRHKARAAVLAAARERDDHERHWAYARILELARDTRRPA